MGHRTKVVIFTVEVSQTRNDCKSLAVQSPWGSLFDHHGHVVTDCQFFLPSTPYWYFSTAHIAALITVSLSQKSPMIPFGSSFKQQQVHSAKFLLVSSSLLLYKQVYHLLKSSLLLFRRHIIFELPMCMSPLSH